MRAADTVYAFRFLKILVTPWNKMTAFKLGLIDDRGKKLRSPETSEERAAYSYFYRLVFNIKRIMSIAPGGSSRIASYAAALYLIKESEKLNSNRVDLILEVLRKINIDTTYSLSELCYTLNVGGNYVLKNDAISPITGDIVALKNSVIEVTNISPIGNFAGIPIYEGRYNNNLLIFTPYDI